MSVALKKSINPNKGKYFPLLAFDNSHMTHPGTQEPTFTSRGPQWVIEVPDKNSGLCCQADTGIKDFVETTGVDNPREDDCAILPLDLVSAAREVERQVEAGEHLVGVLSQVLLDIESVR